MIQKYENPALYKSDNHIILPRIAIPDIILECAPQMKRRFPGSSPNDPLRNHDLLQINDNGMTVQKKNILGDSPWTED